MNPSITQLEPHELRAEVSFFIWDVQEGKIVIAGLITSVDPLSHPRETLYNLMTDHGHWHDYSLEEYFQDPQRYRFYKSGPFEDNLELLNELPHAPKLLAAA